MCLGIPGKVIALKGKRAKIEQGNHTHWVDISLLEELHIGDYLLTYQEVAINKISPSEARNILNLVNSESVELEK